MNKRVKDCLILLLGSAIQAFGLYNIHAQSKVTEGGVLGLVLLIKHWTNLSPAVTGFVLNAICFLIGLKVLGKTFIVYSAICGVGFSAFYAVIERIGPLFPQIAQLPLLAAVLGALFIGVGVGLCVRVGGAAGGDDALAMSLSKVLGVDIERVYLVSDLIVLGLSLTYIKPGKIVYSLVTVVLSGQLIGIIQRAGRGKPTQNSR